MKRIWLSPEDVEETMEQREFRPGGGGRKSRPDRGFGLEKKGEKVKQKFKEDIKKKNKELVWAKGEIEEQIRNMLRKETNPALFRGVKDYFEWVRLGLLALSEAGQSYEIMSEKDLKMDYVKASGSGGQNVNKRNTAVSIRHNPTMFFLKNKKTKKQFENEDQARELMLKKLENHLICWERVIGDGSPNEVMAKIFEKVSTEREAGSREVEVLERMRLNLKEGRNL